MISHTLARRASGMWLGLPGRSLVPLCYSSSPARAHGGDEQARHSWLALAEQAGEAFVSHARASVQPQSHLDTSTSACLVACWSEKV
jgi:hypothetical protein